MLFRSAHREDIDALVGDWIARLNTDDAVETLQKHHVPAGPVRALRDAFDDEHFKAREMVVPLEHPSQGPVPGVLAPGMPIKFRNHPAAFDAPAPVAGAHNADVYGRLLGLGAADLEKLRADGVV